MAFLWSVLMMLFFGVGSGLFIMLMSIKLGFSGPEDGDPPWYTYAPLVVFWEAGVNAGASSFSMMVDGGGLLVIIGMMVMEMFWFPVTIAEGIEALLLNGYDLNGWERS